MIGRLKVLCSFALFAIAPLSFAAPGVILRVGKPVAGRYIVIFDNTKVADGAQAAAEIIAQGGLKKEFVYEGALRGFAFTGSEASALAVSRDPRVKWAQEDSELVADLVQSPAPSWGLDRVDQQTPVTRDINGNWTPGQYTASYTGAGTAIYIVDSGITPISSEFGSRIRESHNWAVGPSGTVDPNYTSDCFNHGTRVASMAAGTVYGIAKDAAIINLRVLDCGNAYGPTSSTVIAGINWMVNDHMTNHAAEPAVANMSLGSSVGTDAALDTAVMNAVQSGITVVTSAGNSSTDACTRSPSHLGNPNQVSPPSGASIITVGATELTDAIAPYSNWGACVDVLAPGSDSDAMNNNGIPSHTYTGTSFAAPLVSGVAAIHMQRYGLANNPSAIEGLIHDNATQNAVSGNLQGTPNLLLWNGILRSHICCR